LGVELMAGQGPDMFTSGFSRDIRSAVRSGLIADIYTLMDNCPRTNREDFFTNVLSAFEIDNRLYTFPVSFGFYHVGINTGLPQAYVNRFAQEPTVTIGQLLDIYLDVREQQEFAHLSTGIPISFSSRYSMIEALIAGYIDFDTRTSDLTDEVFVSYLDMLPRVFGRSTHLSGGGWRATPFFANHTLRDFTEKQVFFMDSQMLNPVHAFLGDEAYFARYRPLADDRGRLLINNNSMHSDSVWAAFSITSAGQQELAWEFMQYLIKAYAQPLVNARRDPVQGRLLPIGLYSLSTPIKRAIADEHLRNVFEYIEGFYDAFNKAGELSFTNFDTSQERAAQIEAAINRINAYNEMPMAMLSPMLPWILFLGSHGGNVNSFMSGAITAEAYAQLIHNSVALWLIE
ncbi:MAG: hypothetical protein FWB80_13555, partial [Defluviitaleaceae bacterium]|nr:hypothetical protein [Defluviitaleaceae bacterium]